MPDVAVLVVNYGTAELTGRALRAARAAAPGLTVEEVVVDNGSTDATVAALAEHAPGARIVRERENRGFAAGVNAGVRAAGADLLFVLNSDAFCRADALARLAGYLDRHPRVGVVAPRLLHEDGRMQVNAYRRFPNLVTLFFEFTAPLHLLGDTALHPHALAPSRRARPGRVAHVMGAAMLVRRAAYQAAGPLDESYFLYLEETEWQRRLVRAGWEIHLEPAAEVVHLEHGSSDATAVSPYFLESAVRFYGPRALPVMRAGARISVLSARVARRLRPDDERFPKLERSFSSVLERLDGAGRWSSGARARPAGFTSRSVDGLAVGQIAAARVKQRIVAHRWIAPLKPAAQRAQYVTQPGRFFAREALRRRVGARYSLRAAPDVTIAVRHLTPDLESFDQIFVQRALAPPEPVEAAIQGLGRPPRVLDLGANVGLSAGWFAACYPGARVVCVEPDPFNLEALEQAAAAAGGRWRVVAAAAAAADGTLTFELGRNSMSRATEGSGRRVRAVDAFALAAQEKADIWKIDIEGGEWPLLLDPRFADVAATAIGIEVHPYMCPEPDAPSAARTALERAGFTVAEMPHVRDAPAGEAALWAWRP